MGWFDSHTHLTAQVYEGQVEAVLERARQAEVTEWLTVGTSLADSREAAALSKRFAGLYGTVGIHPHEAQEAQDEDTLSELKQLAEDEKIVAIGEIGLDYHYDFSPRKAQRRAFEAQLSLAAETGRAVIVHCREAWEDCRAMLKAWNGAKEKVLFHSFSGGVTAAKQALDQGAWVSFSGMVTFKNASEVQAAAAYVPLDRVLIETDCPYLSPAPKRKVKPNEPALLVHTGEKLAELQQVPAEEIARVTTDNSRCFFGITC